MSKNTLPSSQPGNAPEQTRHRYTADPTATPNHSSNHVRPTIAAKAMHIPIPTPPPAARPPEFIDRNNSRTHPDPALPPAAGSPPPGIHRPQQQPHTTRSTWNLEPGVRSREPGVRSQVSGVRNLEPGVRSRQEPGAGSQRSGAWRPGLGVSGCSERRLVGWPSSLISVRWWCRDSASQRDPGKRASSDIYAGWAPEAEGLLDARGDCGLQLWVADQPVLLET